MLFISPKHIDRFVRSQTLYCIVCVYYISVSFVIGNTPFLCIQDFLCAYSIIYLLFLLKGCALCMGYTRVFVCGMLMSIARILFRLLIYYEWKESVYILAYISTNYLQYYRKSFLGYYIDLLLALAVSFYLLTKEISLNIYLFIYFFFFFGLLVFVWG